MLPIIIIAIIFLIGVYAIYNHFYPPTALAKEPVPNGILTTIPPSISSLPNAYVQGTMYPNPTWTLVWSNGPIPQFDLGEAATNALFAKTLILCRTCSSCSDPTYATTYYQRLTPIPDGWSMYANIVNIWGSVNNMINTDFKMYGSDKDLVDGTNPWQYCDYDDSVDQIGGFRNCGPAAPGIANQWNTIGPLQDRSQTVSYFVLNLPGVPGVQPSMPK